MIIKGDIHAKSKTVRMKMTCCYFLIEIFLGSSCFFTIVRLDVKSCRVCKYLGIKINTSNHEVPLKDVKTNFRGTLIYLIVNIGPTQYIFHDLYFFLPKIIW